MDLNISNQYIVFKCKNCGHRLTNVLSSTEEVLTRFNKQNLKEDDSYIQQGYYYKEQFVNNSIHYFIHINDAPMLENHTDKDRFHGCCGISSINGLLNKVCGHCNKELAEIYTDCLAPNHIRLVGEWVELYQDKIGFYSVLTHDFVQEKLKYEWPRIEKLYHSLENKLVAIELMVDLLSYHENVPKELSTWLWEQF